MTVNTYAVTFYDENDTDPLDVEVREITVRSAVEAEALVSGEWDAHAAVVAQARAWADLSTAWEPSHITLPNGSPAEFVEVLPGL